MKIKHDAAHCCELMTEIQRDLNTPWLYHVATCTDSETYVVTNSGGKKRYVIGRNDLGEPFFIRATHLEES